MEERWRGDGGETWRGRRTVEGRGEGRRERRRGATGEDTSDRFLLHLLCKLDQKVLPHWLLGIFVHHPATTSATSNSM